MVDGCGKPSRNHRQPLCEAHYCRQWRNGDLEDHRRQAASVLKHSNGYLLVPRPPSHPLNAGKVHGYEYQHRLVFYDHHGDGPFECHWCGTGLTWDDMHVDHVNADKKDNRPVNLVASCMRCNTDRGRDKLREVIRERAKKISFGGECLTLGEWAARLGISRESLIWRLHRWPLERAMTERRGKSGPQRQARR